MGNPILLPTYRPFPQDPAGQGDRNPRCGQCLAFYYLVWFVVVAVVMVVSFQHGNVSPRIFIFPVATFVAPLIVVQLYNCLSQNSTDVVAETELSRGIPGTSDLSHTSHIPPSPTAFRGTIVHPWHVYSHGELALATDNFDQARIVGVGGQATVFKGVIETPLHGAADDQKQARNIAIKRFYHVGNDEEELRQADVQFIREVTALTRASHRNVVEFYGYCMHGRERFLVYEFMAKGSLHDWLIPARNGARLPRGADDAVLPWARRLAIARDAARGLDYLHNQSTVNLVHLDIKPQNILLDENLNAKIADFGLSKLIESDQTRLRGTFAGGTFGYVAPELNISVEGWENNITKKADVYSFGIVLFQLVSGRSVRDAATVSPGIARPGLTFRDAAFFLVRTQKTHELIDPSLSRDAANSSAHVGMRMAEIGAHCVEIIPADRPDMHQVSEMLEDIEC